MRPNEPTTPPPVYASNAMTNNVVAERMNHDEKKDVRLAAHLARTQYPGPAGELLHRELMTWEEFGYRFDNSSLIRRLIEQILGTAKPKDD